MVPTPALRKQDSRFDYPSFERVSFSTSLIASSEGGFSP
jgi:hypothetical protein